MGQSTNAGRIKRTKKISLPADLDRAYENLSLYQISYFYTNLHNTTRECKDQSVSLECVTYSKTGYWLLVFNVA